MTDVSALTSLEKLKVLYLGKTKVKEIPEIKTLRELEIGETLITDLSPLAKIQGLRILYAAKLKLKDISPLYTIKTLKTFEVYNTEVPRDQLKELQKKVPDCQIHY